jgi:hypothetical protein
MSEKQVITQEELKSVETLRNSSTDLIFEFGQVELEIMMTEKRLTELKNHKASLEDRYNNLQKDETKLVQSLNEKYGAGTLNIESGEFVAS